jgi:transposase InsO family protein
MGEIRNLNSSKNKNLNASKDSDIRRAYYDLESPAAFAGINKVYKEAKVSNPRISRGDVEKYLQSEKTYTLHRPSRKRYNRLRTIPTGLNSDWQCDLAIFDKIKARNNGYPYLLVCIDVLSRKLVVSPTKSKSSEDMIKAFDKIWKKSGVFPNKLYSDQGLEFQAKKMLDYFSRKQIIKHVMYSPNLHAGVVERANRTIKERLYRYFTQNNTTQWIDVIDKIVDSINNSINRTIGIAPNQVTIANSQSLLRKIYKEPEPSKKPRFNKGDIIRINKEKGIFSKGYLPNYTEELFRIFKVKHTDPPHYKIKDLEGEDILGVFYEPEISFTSLEPNSRISEVIKERSNRKGEIEYLVHWIGESSNKDEWITLNDKLDLFKV